VRGRNSCSSAEPGLRDGRGAGFVEARAWEAWSVACAAGTAPARRGQHGGQSWAVWSVARGVGNMAARACKAWSAGSVARGLHGLSPAWRGRCGRCGRTVRRGER
jgi:hypothetical protein